MAGRGLLRGVGGAVEVSTDQASMFENERRGHDRGARETPAGAASVQPPQDVVTVLRAHGGDYARLLRQRRPGTRADGSGWRFYADATARAAGEDVEVHQILVDVSVAAQHLGTNDALRSYAISKRRRVEGPLAAAFLEGMLDRVDRFPHDVLRLDR